jgi:hypothetical protein
VRDTLQAHLGSHQVARVIYGAIIGLALIVAVEDHPPTAGVMLVWLLGTALTVALAEAYSDILGSETREHHRVTRDELRPMLVDAGAVFFGVAFPGVYFVIAWLSFLDVEGAFRLARWTGLGLIGFYGYWAQRLSGGSVRRALVHGAGVAAVAGCLIALKALVH